MDYRSFEKLERTGKEEGTQGEKRKREREEKGER